MRMRLVVVAALLATASGAASATASAKPTGFKFARHAVMAGTTTLQWTGAAGIVLDLPPGATLQDGDVALTSRNASYAFVRLVPEHDYSECPTAAGPRCLSWRFDYIRSLNDSAAFASTPRDQRHSSAVTMPPVWHERHLDAYLFTDGLATVTMRWEGLHGHAGYVPSGRLHGRAEAVPTACMPLGCDTTTGRSNGVIYGGDRFDLAGRGWVDVTSVFSTDPDNKPVNDNTGNQIHGQSYCFYPNPSEPAASADPADHPYGCGLAPADSADATSDALVLANQGASSIPSTFTAYSNFWSGASGRSYVGIRADGAGPNASRAMGYAVWFRYGIT